MIAFLRYLLAYPEFRKVVQECKVDLEQNGFIGQPARNNDRYAAWFRRRTI